MTSNLRLLIAKKGSPSPVGILALLQYIPSNAINYEWKDAPVPSIQLTDDKGITIDGVSHIARFIARTFPECALYGRAGGDAALTSSIDSWVDFAERHLLVSNFQLLNASLLELNHHLKMRTFFVGYQVTLADLCVYGALKSNGIWLKVAKGDSAPPFLLRWFRYIGSLPDVQKAASITPPAAAKPAKSAKGGASKTSDQEAFDISLANAEEGKVCTRFPPEASGYLHIGHAKAALLNQYFAQKYKGKLIVRFDDTNPSKEKQEFEDSILEDLKQLHVKGDVLTWTSDHFDTLYKYALELINLGMAYVDDTTQEVMRQQRMDGEPSKNRDLSIEENLKRFEEMKSATEFGQTCCLRAKISVDAKNKALRDPVIYRCNLLPHNRTGDKWKIYPTYDFACPIVDSIEGVSHALRTTEYHDRNDQYYWFCDTLKIRKPLIYDFSRVNFVYTLLSKRKLAWFVDQGLVTGWDDPRFPTVRGILRRGMTYEALKMYTLMQGASKNTLLMDWDKIWALNKQIIDPISPRYCALLSKNLTEVRLSDGPAEEYEKENPRHKKNPDLGMKKTVYSKVILLDDSDGKDLKAGEEVTMMDWGNVVIEKVTQEGEATICEARLHLEGDFKKTKKKLTWVAKSESNVAVKLIDLDYLITKKKLEEEDTFADCVNPKTEYVYEAVGTGALKEVKKGEIIQLERRGYYICDVAYDPNGSEPIKLIYVPDGKTASTALKYQVPK